MGRQYLLQTRSLHARVGAEDGDRGKGREGVHAGGNICKGSSYFNHIINHYELDPGWYISHMLSSEISPFLFPFYRQEKLRQQG